MSTIHVETLGQAIEGVVLRKGDQGGAVVAEKMVIRDAAVFEMLMEVVAVDDWVLRNEDGVKGMVRTCSALLLLEGALLPALRWRPTNKPLLGIVSACAHKLREVAVDAGGSARKEAALLADSISAYVDDARQVPSLDAVLRDRVDALKERNVQTYSPPSAPYRSCRMDVKLFED